ncbi:hypothetical protein RB594_005371 [Gaeumannomyces avenae]
MTARADADLSADDADFLEHSHLSHLVPFSDEPVFEDLVKPGCGGSKRSPFKALEQRDWLFFDESAAVFLILRTPFHDDKTLRAHLARVTLALEAHITNTQTPGRDRSPPATELIFGDDAIESRQGRTQGQGGHGGEGVGSAGDKAVVDQPLIIIDERDFDGDDNDDNEDKREDSTPHRFAFAIWKVPVFIARPRIRLQSPTVVFTVSAHLRGASPANDETERGPESVGGGGAVSTKDDYMQSRAPAGLNLLEPFAYDAALGGVRPQLSAQRVSRVAPLTRPKDQLRPIRGSQSVALRAVAALHTRVKFARPNAVPASPDVIAMLEMDFTPYFDCEVVLTKIKLGLQSGVVTDLNSDAGLSLPLSCVAHDHVTFLYGLAPPEHEHLLEGVSGGWSGNSRNAPGAPPAARDLDISIEAKALVRPGVCTPRLTMAWTTQLDFTPPVNPGFGASALTPPMQRSHRPSQLSIDGIASMVSPAVSRPDSLPALEAAAARNTETIIPDFGITMTFLGPDRPVRVGEEFCWSVFVVNRSGTGTAPVVSGLALSIGAPQQHQPSPLPTATPTTLVVGGSARKLALRVVPKRRRADLRVTRPPSSHRASHGRQQSLMYQRQQQARGNGIDSDEVADAVLDENVVHAMQRGSLVDGADVVCLSADARVGPLAPGACHVVELRFLALRAGRGPGDAVESVEAVRVVDLVSQEHVDVRELPAIFVEPEADETS